MGPFAVALAEAGPVHIRKASTPYENAELKLNFNMPESDGLHFELLLTYASMLHAYSLAPCIVMHSYCITKCLLF